MEFKLLTYREGKHPIVYRQNTTDLNVLKEVLEKKGYSRPKLKFDVEPGEHWLDLGANIGAFSLYCVEKKAGFHAFEPDISNFKILMQNVGWAARTIGSASIIERKAVTVTEGPTITFWKDKSHSRRSCYYNKNKRKGYQVSNLPARSLVGLRMYDGVKMDIEGSEGPIIDCRFLPKCKKLVLEYHTSVDPSVENLARRIRILQDMFDHVHYIHRSMSGCLRLMGNSW